MSCHAKIMVAVGVALVQFCQSAATLQITGFGSGKDLRQALCVAQGDAVLNAGANTGVSGESGKSVSTGVFFLKECKIIEKGESFDGFYVRIQATLCDEAERSFDGAKTLTGEGRGVSARAAREHAIGNALMDLGVRVRAVGTYDKGELVRDETEFTGRAYVSDIEELENASVDGDFLSKVRFKAFAGKDAAKGDADIGKSTFGFGRNVLEAMAAARTRAVLDLNASYVARNTYEAGVLKSRAVERTWRGFCYGTTLLGKQQDANGWRLDLGMHFDDNVGSNHASGVSQSIGFGIAARREEALEYAKWDAVLNSGCSAEIGMCYEDGKESISKSRLVGSGYVGKIDVEYGEAGETLIAEITAPVSLSEESDSQCALAESTGDGCGSDAHKAFLLARLHALANGGARYSVDRSYEGDLIVATVCEMAARRDSCSFIIMDQKDAEVLVRMTVPSGEGHVMKGMGVASSEATAREFARCDAALNACSSVDFWARYENGKMVGSRQKLHGKPYLIGCDEKVARLPDGRFLATATAGVASDLAYAGEVLKRGVPFEGRPGDSWIASVCAARRGLLVNAGATVDASMEYKDLELTAAFATYRATGILSACQVDVSKQNGGYFAKAFGRVLPGVPAVPCTRMKVFGYGSGASFDEARAAAVEDAVINANSRFSVEEVFEQGEYVCGRSEYEADGFVFGYEILDVDMEGDRHVVKVQCEISSGQGDGLAQTKEVAAKGWGPSEVAAKADAECNAIAAAYGRQVHVSLKEADGRVEAVRTRDSALENDFFVRSQNATTLQKWGLFETTIQATVYPPRRQEPVRPNAGKEEDNDWSFLTVVIVIVILLTIVATLRAHKGAGLAFALWLFFFIMLMVTGHWVTGVLFCTGLAMFDDDDD